jgi:hypothetical protein
MNKAREKIAPRTQQLASASNLQSAAKLLPPNMRGGLQIKEAAAYLGLSEISVRRLIKRGILKPCRITTRLIFPVAQLNRVLEG